MIRKMGFNRSFALILILSCLVSFIAGCIEIDISSDDDQKDIAPTGENSGQKEKPANDSTNQKYQDNSSQPAAGTYLWPNGDRYEGDLKNGLPEGQGTFSRKSDKTGQWEVIYEGQWRDGKMNGNGTMTNTDGDIYTGNWVDNMPSGQGTIKFRGDGGWQEYSGNFTSHGANNKGPYSEWDGVPPWDYYPTIPGQ